MEYEIGGCSVVDPACLLFESLCIESFDSNSEFKGGEFKSANHRVSVFHLKVLAFLLSVYIISEKRVFLKCAIKSQVRVQKVQEKVQW